MYLLFRIMRKIIVFIDYLICSNKEVRKIIVEAFLLDKQICLMMSGYFNILKTSLLPVDTFFCSRIVQLIIYVLKQFSFKNL